MGNTQDHVLSYTATNLHNNIEGDTIPWGEKKKRDGQRELPLRYEGHRHLEVWLKSQFALVPLTTVVACLSSLSFAILTDPVSSEWVGEGRKLAWSSEVSHCG